MQKIQYIYIIYKKYKNYSKLSRGQYINGLIVKLNSF